jgi:pyruvate/oxaloacetate carboxyltransferase
MARIVEVTDLTLRDAQQGLLETSMSLKDLTPACEDLEGAVYWSLECCGGAAFWFLPAVSERGPLGALADLSQTSAQNQATNALMRSESGLSAKLRRFHRQSLGSKSSPERHRRFQGFRRMQ